MKRCDPSEIALKSLFLGPRSENADWFVSEIGEVLDHTFLWRKSRFPQDGAAISDGDKNEREFIELQRRTAESLRSLLRELESETPKFTPRYIGHMVSEISLPALLAEFAMLLHNPNNASPEASRVGLKIEVEAINDLAKMVGFDPRACRGHFTSGGTLANFEGFWRALNRFDERCAHALHEIGEGHATPAKFFDLCHRDARPDSGASRFSFLAHGAWALPFRELLGRDFEGPVLLVPGNKHYSWPKAASVFGLGRDNLWAIALDEEGRLDVDDLRAKIELARSLSRPVLMVVSVAGTTELGEVDPVDEVQDLLDEYASRGLSIWHHVDAAYGGFLASVRTPMDSFDERTVGAFRGLARVDSVTLDPHKLGYIPYACGAFLTRNADRYRTSSIEAPYLKNIEPTAPGWATTLEGSRSAAGAAAMWLTARTLSLDERGFGKILAKTFEAKDAFTHALAALDGIRLVTPADTNVLCFAVAAPDLAALNEVTSRAYEKIEAGPDFSVSRTQLSRAGYGRMIERLCREWNVRDDGRSDLFVIRLVLMNPFIVSKEMNTNFSSEFADVVRRATAP